MNANPPPAPPATADIPPRFLFSLWFVVWLTVVLVATLVTLVLPESFMSSARIKVERDQTDIRGVADKPAVSADYDPYFIQTEFEIIQSETILGKVIEVLNLNDVWGKQYYDGIKLKTPETMRMLRGRLNLRPVRTTTLLDIQVFSENPKEAADLANQIAVTYLQWRLDQGKELAIGGLKSLAERAKVQDAAIARAKQELASLAEPVANEQRPDARKLAYREKEKDLEEMQDLRRLLTRKINLEEIDQHLPKSAQVMIIERAVPGARPVRPNVPLNITLSILIGGLVGLVLATLVYLLQRLAFHRRSGVAIPMNLSRLRTVLRVTIALVVGVILGYNCAMPTSAASLFFTQFFVFLGGIAFAFVELAKPSSAPLPSPSQPETPPPVA